MDEVNRDLLSYLGEQAGQGVKESEGEFSISLEAARSKLARFALPRPNAWVLKLVQAAVGWQMTRIEITQYWKETRFFLVPPPELTLPDEKQILAALMSGQVLADSPLAHFCLALRALVEQAGQSFLLIAQSGEEISKPLYAGAYYSKLGESKRLARAHNRGVGLTLYVRHELELKGDMPAGQLFGLQSTGMAIIQELRNHAYLSPIPLLLAGRPQEGLLEGPHFRFEWQRPMALSGVEKLKHSPSQLPVPPSFQKKQLSYLTSSGRAARDYTLERRFACVYSLSAMNRAEPSNFKTRLSYMCWVCSGVVVQSAVLGIETRTLGIQIYGNADGLPTDLTGFQLLQQREFLQRQQEIYLALADSVLGWMDDLEGFFRVDRDELSEQDDKADRISSLRKRGPSLIGGTVVGLWFSLAVPHVFLPITAAGVGRALLKKTEAQKAVTKKAKLAAVLQEDLAALSEGLYKLAADVGIQLSEL
jgi:hypothetical protein